MALSPLKNDSRPPRAPGFLLLALVLFAAPLRLGAQTDYSEPYDQANLLYEQGSYGEAAEAYLRIIEQGADSAAIRFNLGNALYQTGEIGRALTAYHEALTLTPRDPDIKANIQFTREKLGADSFISRSFWQQFLHQLTLNEWSVIALIPFWIWIGTFTVTILTGRSSTIFPILAKGAGIAFLITGIILIGAARERLGRTYAVVTAKEAVVRFGPFEESKSSHNLVDGIEIELLDEKNGWHQIRDPKDQLGWVKKDHIQTLPTLP